MYTNHDTLSFCMVDVLQQSGSWSLTATSLRCIYRDAFGRSSKGEKSFFRKRCGAFGAPLPYTFGIGTHLAEVQRGKEKNEEIVWILSVAGGGKAFPLGGRWRGTRRMRGKCPVDAPSSVTCGDSFPQRGKPFGRHICRPYGRTCEFCAAIRSRAGRGTPKNFPRS